MKFSVLILAYNSHHFIVDCVESVLREKTAVPDIEVLVLDNASTDDTYDALTAAFQNKEGSIFRVNHGLGYAGGNNYLAQAASGDVLFVLNDDCIIEAGVFQSLTDEFSRRDSPDLIQCGLTDRSGEHWDTLGHFIDRLAFLRSVADGQPVTYGPRESYPLFGAAGAAFAIKRAAFEDLKGFDHKFSFLFEETDLCWRAHIYGYTVIGVTSAIVRHQHLSRYKDNALAPQVDSPFYLMTRHRLRSILKNFELTTLLYVLPVHIAIVSVFGVLESIRNCKSAPLKDTVRSLQWNIANLSDTLHTRRMVQSRRQTSDMAMVKAGLIVPFSLKNLLNKAVAFKI